MGDKTEISWSDATWNVVTGCSRVSEGCLNCYIYRTPPFRMEGRNFDGPGIGATTGVRLHSDRLGIPQRWTKPRMIFVCSLADLFQDEVPDRFIAEVFAVMAIARQHIFQVLTKRHARLRSLLNSQAFWGLVDAALVVRGREPLAGEGPHILPHVWIGVSTENQKWADIRIPALLDTPAAVRWISAEPLLGAIELKTSWVGASALQHDAPELSWVVVGGESGPSARPMHPHWARSLRDQCVAASVPFHFKQFGEWAPTSEVINPRDKQTIAMHPAGMVALTADNPFNPFERGHPYWEGLRRFGKKTAGRELDGRTWDEFPAVLEAVPR